jgi:hypothetical protein
MSKVSREVAVIMDENSRFPASRRPMNGLSTIERRHIRHVGEIVHAWNVAHGTLFKVFTFVATDWDWHFAHALWHSVSTDKGQRDMVEVFVNEKREAPPPLLKDGILWAIRALNELATYRNDATHVEILRNHPEFVPEVSAKPGTVDRFAASPLASHWRRLRGDLYAIANYLDGIHWALWFGGRRPLSRRPRLLFARTKSGRSQNQRRRAKKSARERQRQSSRA